MLNDECKIINIRIVIIAYFRWLVNPDFGPFPCVIGGAMLYYWYNSLFIILNTMPRKANPALLKPLNLSAELEAVVGKGPMPRSQVVKKLWEYIKKNNLQNPENKRNIFADDMLMPLFGKKEVTMFEMTKLVSPHITDPDKA